MAISLISSESLHVKTAPDTSHSITIPAGCTSGNGGLIEVVLTGSIGNRGAGSQLLDELNFDNGGDQVFTHIRTQYYDATYAQVSAYYMHASDGNFPGTGSQTLYHRTWLINGISEGMNLQVNYWDGIDSTGTLVNTDGRDDSGSDWVSSLTGMSSGDVGCVAGYDYDGTPDIDVNSQTKILEALNYSAGFANAYKIDESGMDIDAANGYLIPIAWAYKAVAAGGDLSIPIATFYQLHHR